MVVVGRLEMLEMTIVARRTQIPHTSRRLMLECSVGLQLLASRMLQSTARHDSVANDRTPICS